MNRTLPAAPSSAPRDLTVNPHPHDADNEEEGPAAGSVILNWQPPKYANGEIEEYIVLYSDRLELPDREWIMDSVKGERTSIVIDNLLPRATYYFKIQARNIKGYGPLSPVATYIPVMDSNGAAHAPSANRAKNSKHGGEVDDFYTRMGELVR